MSILKVITFPNSIIRRRCEPVTDINEDVVRFAKDMADTMYASKGIGLAAPQVAVSKQIIVLDIGEGLITLINPQITQAEGKAKMEEGCLCLPKLLVEVERQENVQVKGVDLNGKELCFDAEGLLARVFQHEIDHLHGTLIIDRLSKIKRDIALRQYHKLNKQ